MYTVRLDLDNFVNNIDRMLTINVVKQFLNKMGLRDNIKILTGEHAIDLNKNSLGDLQTTDTLRSEFVKVEYAETSVDNYELSLELINPDYKEILNDREMYVKLTPVYHMRTVTLSIKYYNKSKIHINKLINKLRTLPTSTGQLSYNDIEYFYNLPRFAVMLLSHFIYLRNNVVEDTITLEEYVEQNFTRGDLANNLTANYIKSNVVIKESQVNVVGIMDDDLHNIEAEFDDEENSWFTVINYKFNYERPIFIDLQYPILCYNQLIDKYYRKLKVINDNKYQHAKGNQALIDAKDSNDALLKSLKWNGEYYIYPKQDNCKLEPVKIKASRILTTLVTIDKDDPYTLMSLNGVPGITFKDDIVKVLYLESDYISKPYESIFYIEVYNNNSKLYNELYIEAVYDDDDNIIDYLLKSIEPIALNNVIRVSFSIVYNLNYIVTNRLEDMINNFYIVNKELVNDSTMYPRGLVDVLGVFNVNDNITNYEIYNLDFQPYLNMKTKLVSLIQI